MEREIEERGRRALGRSGTKHVLPTPEEGVDGEQLEAYPNDRYHYGVFGFLQRRRGGGGASTGSGGGKSAGVSSGELAVEAE